MSLNIDTGLNLVQINSLHISNPPFRFDQNLPQGTASVQNDVALHISGVSNKALGSGFGTRDTYFWDNVIIANNLTINNNLTVKSALTTGSLTISGTGGNITGIGNNTVLIPIHLITQGVLKSNTDIAFNGSHSIYANYPSGNSTKVPLCRAAINFSAWGGGNTQTNLIVNGSSINLTVTRKATGHFAFTFDPDKLPPANTVYNVVSSACFSSKNPNGNTYSTVVWGKTQTGFNIFTTSKTEMSDDQSGFVDVMVFWG